MKIAIASGKGGTGKTTVAINLALILSEIMDVTLYDCDVEAPNDELFLKSNIEDVFDVKVMIPQIDESRCIKCGKCAEICNFHSFAFFKKMGKVLFFPNMCHSCGACVEMCP
ncbi:4Fe-4S binding protein, partial [Candidatus Dependentiae bacterium]|nr:4Fe-4S binding protein [Candidatus Dependentiae bacterium]